MEDFLLSWVAKRCTFIKLLIVIAPHRASTVKNPSSSTNYRSQQVNAVMLRRLFSLLSFWHPQKVLCLYCHAMHSCKINRKKLRFQHQTCRMPLRVHWLVFTSWFIGNLEFTGLELLYSSLSTTFLFICHSLKIGIRITICMVFFLKSAS